MKLLLVISMLFSLSAFSQTIDMQASEQEFETILSSVTGFKKLTTIKSPEADYDVAILTTNNGSDSNPTVMYLTFNAGEMDSATFRLADGSKFVSAKMMTKTAVSLKYKIMNLETLKEEAQCLKVNMRFDVHEGGVLLVSRTQTKEVIACK